MPQGNPSPLNPADEFGPEVVGATITCALDGTTHTITVSSATPPNWFDPVNQVITKSGLYMAGFQLIINTNPTTAGLFVAGGGFAIVSEMWSVDGLVKVAGFGQTPTYAEIGSSIQSGWLGTTMFLHTPNDATGKIDVIPFVTQLAS